MTNTQSKPVSSHDGQQQQAAVRGRTLVPVIGLERFSYGTLEKGTYLTIKLRSDPSNKDSVTHDFAVPFFSSGGPEEWILFRKNLKRVFTGQALTSGPAQYQMTRSLLEGDALSHFETAAAAQTSETVDSLKKCLNDLTSYVFPERAEQQQKRWMRRQLFKPRKWSTREFAGRVTELNSYFKFFPKKQDENNNPVEPTMLPTDEKLDILEFGSPKAFQLEMTHQGFDPIAATEREFIQFCERLERTEEQNGHQPNEPRSSKHKKNKNKCPSATNSEGGGKRQKTGTSRYDASKTCLIHGPGHSSDDCQVLKAQAERMKATYKAQTPDGKKKLKDKQELNALIADQVEKQLSKGKRKKKFTEDEVNNGFTKMRVNPDDSSVSTADFSGSDGETNNWLLG